MTGSNISYQKIAKQRDRDENMSNSITWTDSDIYIEKLLSNTIEIKYVNEVYTKNININLQNVEN